MGLFDKIIGGGLKGLADGATSVINAINAPKEEKERALAAMQELTVKHEEFMTAQANDVIKSYLADIQSARTMQIAALNQTDNFSKRFLYYLATFIIISAVGFGCALMYIQIPKENQRMVEMFADVFLFAGAMIVIQFFFGSSKSSHDKENTRNVLEVGKSPNP